MNTAMADPLNSPKSQTLSNNSFFTPLVISIMGISATALAILFYHLLLVRYCIRRHAARMAALRTFAGEEIPTGVDEKTLSTIPIITFKKPNLKPSSESSELSELCEPVDDENECAVCLGDLEEGDAVRVLPDCKHLFHVKCIDEWFSGHTSCPVCRVPVVAPDGSCPVCRAVGTLPVPTTPTTMGDDYDRTRTTRTNCNTGSDGSGPIMGGLTSVPRVMLRHCHSLVLPGEKKGRLTGMELKRSLSMGQSTCVIIDINIDYVDKECPYYSGNTGIQSMLQLQRVSTKVKQSISRMCVGQAQEGVLPY